jgi:hypothetical protein
MVGKDRKSMLVFPMGISRADELVGLRSDKLSDSDIKKLKENAHTIGKMNLEEAQEFLKFTLSSYHESLVEMKKNRYTIISEHEI